RPRNRSRSPGLGSGIRETGGRTRLRNRVWGVGFWVFRVGCFLGVRLGLNVVLVFGLDCVNFRIEELKPKPKSLHTLPPTPKPPSLPARRPLCCCARIRQANSTINHRSTPKFS